MGAFDPVVTFEKGTYIETDTGNKVSRKATILGATNIVLGGKSIIQTRAIIRGDLRRSAPGQHVVVSMGRYCLISEGVVLRPPGKIYKGAFTFYPVRVADYVHIGPDAIVEAASIGHGVEIGARAVVGKFVIIKDLALILPDAVLPDGTVVPSMTIWGGNPARIVGTLPETYQETIEEKCKGYYQRFRSV
ncbi:Dynactin subunit 5 [Vanrija pseudolonga]|uniref:Dynactin subunit 5 n=2 Tax=Vanrija TaxID=1851468 RepID=A0AAF0Y766_9TREE|nr:Dynactin subunit 5 [Vanrija pseudolonga]